MLIKKKSLIVAFISSLVVSLVLILTLVGYVAYLELKDRESNGAYHDLLQKISTRIYAKYMDISNISAKIESVGALKGKPVIEGVIKNNGYKNITDILLKVKFLDKDGSIIYEVVFHPQEPPLGTMSLSQVSISYLTSHSKAVIMAPTASMPFKKILVNCPEEILDELKANPGYMRHPNRWAGKFNYEVISVEFWLQDNDKK